SVPESPGSLDPRIYRASVAAQAVRPMGRPNAVTYGHRQARSGKDACMRVEQELEGMGLALPEVAAGIGSFIPAVQTGNLLFVSGNTGARLYEFRGKLGEDVTIEQGYEAAKCAMLGCLAAARSVIGDLDRIERVVKLLGFVNAGAGFTETPNVI